LSSCHDSISSLKRSNADLNARIEKLDIASSFVEHVSICNRCKDFDVDACNNHVSTISKLNDEIANLNAKLKTCKSECEKIKFVRDAYTIGRHPSIKDGLGFQKGTKNLTSQRASSLIKEKGKAPIVALILFMTKRTMHICMIMLGMPLILCIMMVVIIMLFFLYVMVLSLILMPCLHLQVIRMFMVGVDPGAMFTMLFLMSLEIQLMAQL
jgi:hypothetical protein